MQYIKILNNLQQSINNKGYNERFLISLKQLKKDFGFNISTKFLRDLCNFLDFRKRTKRINYLLKATGLKTKKEYRHYAYWDLNKYDVPIIEYTYNKKYKLREEEKAYIKSIKNQEIGKEFLNRKKEVLFMVNII